VLELSRPHACLADRVARIERQLLLGLNAAAARHLARGGHARALPVLRTAEALIAAAGGRLDAALVRSTWELCGAAHRAGSRSITNVGSHLSARARRRRAAQYDARVAHHEKRRQRVGSQRKARAVSSPSRAPAPASPPPTRSTTRRARKAWDAGQAPAIRIGEPPPPLPEPLYPSREASKYAWASGDAVLARHPATGTWVKAALVAKRRKPGGGWYVESSEGRLRTAEIRPCAPPRGATNAGKQPSPRREHTGTHLMDWVEEIAALTTALRHQSPSAEEMREAQKQLEEEDRVARRVAAGHEQRLRAEAEAAANRAIEDLLEATMSEVEIRRKAASERFFSADADSDGTIDRHELKTLLLAHGIGKRVDVFLEEVEQSAAHSMDGKLELEEGTALVRAIEAHDKVEPVPGALLFDEDTGLWSPHHRAERRAA